MLRSSHGHLILCGIWLPFLTRKHGEGAQPRLPDSVSKSMGHTSQPLCHLLLWRNIFTPRRHLPTALRAESKQAPCSSLTECGPRALKHFQWKFLSAPLTPTPAEGVWALGGQGFRHADFPKGKRGRLGHTLTQVLHICVSTPWAAARIVPLEMSSGLLPWPSPHTSLTSGRLSQDLRLNHLPSLAFSLTLGHWIWCAPRPYSLCPGSTHRSGPPHLSPLPELEADIHSPAFWSVTREYCGLSGPRQAVAQETRTRKELPSQKGKKKAWELMGPSSPGDINKSALERAQVWGGKPIEVNATQKGKGPGKVLSPTFSSEVISGKEELEEKWQTQGKTIYKQLLDYKRKLSHHFSETNITLVSKANACCFRKK